MPASIPPARFVRRSRPGSISSCASVPRRRASSKPSPTSTPFTAWIPISANASRASSRSVFSAYEPKPGRDAGRRRTSTIPPSVSRSFARRVGRVAHPFLGRLAADLDRATGDLDPELAEERLRDRAGGDVDGGVARRGTLERVADVVVVVLEDAGEVGVPRPGQRDGLRALPGRASPSGGHGLIPHVQFAWSRLRTTSVSGVPSVSPCRSPASTSTSSDSSFWRGLRPYPCWRRRRSPSIASLSSRSPAGRPVTIATSAGPCDSPAVTRWSAMPRSYAASGRPRTAVAVSGNPVSRRRRRRRQPTGGSER